MSVVRPHWIQILVALAFYISIWGVRELYPEYSQLVTLIIFYTALGQAFNIFLGMTGYVDFGYVAFLALGMYGGGLAVQYVAASGLPPELALVLGPLQAVMLASAVALAVGGVALRLRGAYFAIATVGVNEGLRYLIEGAKIWGGGEGLIMARDLRTLFGDEGFSYITTVYADTFLAFTAATAAIVTWILKNSRIGYGLAALREDEAAARVMGINTTAYKVTAFIISAIFGSLIGSAWGLKIIAIYPPEAFNITYTIEAIIVVMIGGRGTLFGPIIGGTLYTLAKYYLGVLIPGSQLLIFSLLLITAAIAFPYGLLGHIRTYIKSHTIREVLG
ncbi:MAG: branched-chain amino acid ABC transporter permease [Sulfolobales archaeon]